MVASKNILVLGLGNDILMDDAIGPKLVWEIQKIHPSDQIAFLTAGVGGLELMELMQGYERVVIIDAIKTAGGVPGTVYHLTPEDFKETLHCSNLHDISFLQALEVGKKLNLSVPEKIDILAIEIVEDLTFGNEYSPLVQAAYPQIFKSIMALITPLIRLS